MGCSLSFYLFFLVAVTVLTFFLIDGPLLHLSLWYIVFWHFLVFLRHYLAHFFLLVVVGMVYLGGESVRERVQGKRSDSGMVMRMS